MLLLDNNVTLIITIKEASKKSHQKCPWKFSKNVHKKSTKKRTYRRQKCRQKCPWKFTLCVHENSPFMYMRSLPPSEVPSAQNSNTTSMNMKFLIQPYWVYSTSSCTVRISDRAKRPLFSGTIENYCWPQQH